MKNIPPKHSAGSPRAIFLAALLLLSAGACESRKVPSHGVVEQVFRSNYCGFAEADSELIINKSRWQAITQSGQRFIQAQPPVETMPPFETLAKNALLLLVAAGEKPSAGYGVSVDVDNWQLDGADLLLTVVQRSPAADSLQAAVITSPCVVIALRNFGHIERLRLSGFDAVRELPVTH